jgi:hypothetical protein
MTAFASTMALIGMLAGWVALFHYFRSVDALEKERRRQERAAEFAHAQRRITHERGRT